MEGTQVNGKTWWHVPIVPQSLFRVECIRSTKSFTEIEEVVLRKSSGMDVLLFVGDIRERRSGSARFNLRGQSGVQPQRQMVRDAIAGNARFATGGGWKFVTIEAD